MIHPVESKFRAYLLNSGIPAVEDMEDDSGIKDVTGGEPLRGRIKPSEEQTKVAPPVVNPQVATPPVVNPQVGQNIPPPNNVAINPAQYGAMFPHDELGQAIAQQGVSPGGLGSLV